MTFTQKKELGLSSLVPRKLALKLETGGLYTFFDLLGQSRESLIAILPIESDRAEVMRLVWQHGFGIVNADSYIFRTAIEELTDLASDTTVDEVFPEEAVEDLIGYDLIEVAQVIARYNSNDLSEIAFALRQMYASSLQKRHPRSSCPG